MNSADDPQRGSNDGGVGGGDGRSGVGVFWCSCVLAIPPGTFPHTEFQFLSGFLPHTRTPEHKNQKAMPLESLDFQAFRFLPVLVSRHLPRRP